ncbi:MAG: YdcF family protein [Erysipelotrichales bacterium]
MLKKIIYAIIAVLVIYIIIIGIVLFNGKQDSDNYDIDYLIVPGAKVEGDHPSIVLGYRLDGAYEVYQNNNKIKIIVSGGQGLDEAYSEALVMKNYLVKKGIPEKQIISESNSTNTFENFKFSKELIKEEDASIGLVTNDFHVVRSKMLAQRVFNKEVNTYSVRNIAGPLGISSLFREPLGLIKSYFLDK